MVYPAQRSDANPSKCWNWFRRADQRRDEGEPSLIAGITRQVMQDYSVDPKRVFVAGLSAGGAAAAIMGATYSDLYAAVGIHSGLAYGTATDMPSAFAAMRQGRGASRQAVPVGPTVPTIIFHGDRDTTVHPDNGAQAVEQAVGTTRTRKKVHRGQIPGGHGYTRTTHVDGERGILEHWNIHGAGHAWSGGSPAGSYTDQEGPDATKEMLLLSRESAAAAALVPGITDMVSERPCSKRLFEKGLSGVGGRDSSCPCGHPNRAAAWPRSERSSSDTRPI